MDLTHVLVDVVRAEDGEKDHQHANDMVGEQGVAVAPRKLQELWLHLWCAGHAWQHSLMGWPGNTWSSLLLPWEDTVSNLNWSEIKISKSPSTAWDLHMRALCLHKRRRTRSWRWLFCRARKRVVGVHEAPEEDFLETLSQSGRGCRYSWCSVRCGIGLSILSGEKLFITYHYVFSSFTMFLSVTGFTRIHSIIYAIKCRLT